MSKTEDVIRLLNENKSTAEIKEATGASESLISRCRKKMPSVQQEEEEPSDEEIDSFIKKIKIQPEEKHFTGREADTKQDEEAKCLGCGHIWAVKSKPKFCPNCGVEFE